MRQLGKTAAFWAAALLIWELAFHVTVFGGLSPRWLSSLPFSLGLAAVLAVLSHLWKAPLFNKITRCVLLTVPVLIFGVQSVYCHIFDTLLSLAFVGMGGEAIVNFLPIVVSGIAETAPMLLLYLAAYPALVLLQRRNVVSCERADAEAALVLACCGVLLYALGIPAAGSGDRGAVYYDAQSTVDRQTEYFGLLTAEFLDLGRLTSDTTNPITPVMDLQGGSGGGGGSDDGSGSDGDGGSDSETGRNIIKAIDFGVLNEAAPSGAVRELNNYFSSLSGTAKNEYTGMFQGFNYIQICAEAYSPYLVDREITPTLYKLIHEGIVFENFYNSFPSVTSNGEYSLCMGLMPDLSRMSFATSMENYIPFTIAHLFREQEGRHPIAYHNNYATFYNRINTHTNMGYDFRAIDYGLDMEKGNPASDLEMMEKSVDDFINAEPFAVHYMTYSGHAYYKFETNDMSIKNRERAEALCPDCSEELLAYYACQLELEDAVTYLLRRLEDAGIADRTVIVLTGDHYPYGLSEESYAELAGEEAIAADPFWKYRGSFICWTGALQAEPIHIDDYCSTHDILPTMCNLFGLTYESRMLTGTDVLSDSVHLALIQDGSFLTKALTYDSGSGKITYLQPEEELPRGYAQQLIQAARNQMSVSAAILRTNYYGFVFSALDLAETTEPVVTDRASFSDIDGLWYEDSVEKLVGRGALSGTNDGMFGGENVCTRVMFITMLTRSLYLPSADETDLPFTDVSESSWYYSYVAAGWDAGIIPSAETLGPGEPLTEADARAMFAGAALCVGIEDAEVWADSVIDQVLTQARQEGEAVDEALTRGAAAAIVAQLILATE